MNKKGGVWLFLIIGLVVVVLIVAGYFAVKSVRDEKFIKELGEDVNIRTIKVLKCLQDKTPAGQEAIPESVFFECQVYFDTNIRTTESQDEEYTLLVESSDKYAFGVDAWANVIEKKTLSSVREELEKAGMYYDVDSINY